MSARSLVLQSALTLVMSYTGWEIMTRSDKRLKRLLAVPADFTWDELVAALSAVGFVESTGKGGSYRTFITSSGRKIFLHKPDPGTVLKKYAIREVIDALLAFGLLQTE